MRVGEHEPAAAGEVAAGVPTRPGPARTERWIAAGLLGFALIVLLAHVAPRLAAPFGDSHDGRNAGVWAAGARSLRERGPVASRLGAVSPENGTYANHPPLLYWETAAAQLVSRAPVATRAPAWAGSLVALALLALLLRERGLSPLAAAAGVSAVAASAMFGTYAAMLDTPVTSLPFGLGLLVLWQRVRAGRPVRPVLVFAVAALAPLAGWQALLVAAVTAGWGVAVLARGRRPAGALALVAGAATGALLLAAWLVWVGGGSLHLLVEPLRFRTGTGPGPAATTLATLLESQRRDLAWMFGWGLLAVAAVGLALALRDRRTRALAATALAVAVPYTLAFRTGALGHSYWDYWWLLPSAVGVAVGVDRAVPALASRSARPSTALVAVAAVVVLLATPALRLSPEEQLARRRLASGRLADDAPLPPAQRAAWYAGGVVEPAGWLALATRRPAVYVADASIPALAAEHPDDLVLFGQPICDAFWDGTVVYAWRTAAELARTDRAADCG